MPMEPIDNKVKLADASKIIKGHKRLEGETEKQFRNRRKKERKLLKQRLKFGVSHYSSKVPYRNPDKQVKKAVREQKKAMRKTQKR